ncbi:MAG: glycosyltransferase family 4 protein [Candidatus Thermoplasmatota archaeon]|nr:glycosyltransferase family 4 protein [Candidatus Thermoplasmatota archaeon]
MQKKLQNDNKPKICIVLFTPYPAIGGFENIVYELVNSLSKKIFIQVVCTNIGIQKDIPDNVKIYPILKPFKVRYIGFLIGIFLNSIIFYYFLKTEKPDIIHTHPSFPNGFISLPAKLLGLPIICTSHGVDIQIQRNINYGARQNKFVAILVNLTLKYSSLHTLVSKSMIKDAIEAGSKTSKIRIIYNGINLHKIPSKRKTNIFQKYHLNSNDFIILYLGRLHPKKCPQDLLIAHSETLSRVPNAKLVYAGKGEEESKLRTLASNLHTIDKIIFTGFVSEEEKWDLLKSCDIFVLPSELEGHPITIIEAMACSKPVIATNLGPFPEIIRDGETGLLVPLHDPNILADAITKLALDRTLRENMGKLARKEVEERFDIEKIAADYLKMYDELLKK